MIQDQIEFNNNIYRLNLFFEVYCNFSYFTIFTFIVNYYRELFFGQFGILVESLFEFK